MTIAALDTLAETEASLAADFKAGSINEVALATGLAAAYNVAFGGASTPLEAAVLAQQAISRLTSFIDDFLGNVGLKTKGVLASPADLPASGNAIGDGYLIAGNLWVWAGSDWQDAGPITGADGVDGTDGVDGEDGSDGNDAWTPVFAAVADGVRRVLRVIDWTGGEGSKPTTGLYLGPTGLTATLASATDVRGAAALDGEDGSDGVDGWTPLLANVVDGERRVQRIVDWVGGEGTKPTTGHYVGPLGLTANIAEATNMRGAAGANGSGTGDMIAANNLSDLVDPAVARSNLSVLSATQVAAAITAAIDALITGAPGALDTLNELAAALGHDPNFAATVMGAVGARLAKDQNLADLANASTALTNLGLSANGKALATAANYAAMRLLLGVSNAAVLMINGVAPDGAGNISITAAGGALASDVARAMMMIAELRGTLAGTSHGFADSFSDQTGIDTGASSATFDNSLKLYKTPTAPAYVLPTNTSNAAPSGGASFRANTELNGSFAAWKANDGIVDAGGSARWVTSGFSPNGWLEMDLGIARQMTAYQLNGYVAAATTQETDSWSLYGSNSPMGGAGGTLLDSRSGQAPWSDNSLRNYLITTPGDYRYYEWRNVVPQSGAGSTYSSICEIDATFATAPVNLDLRSIPYTHPDGVPTKASLTALLKLNGGTINTNVIAEVSRDNGATWLAVGLVAKETSGGFTYFEAADFSLASLPSGSTLRRRLRTTAFHAVEVTGWALYSG